MKYGMGNCGTESETIKENFSVKEFESYPINQETQRLKCFNNPQFP